MAERGSGAQLTGHQRADRTRVVEERLKRGEVAGAVGGVLEAGCRPLRIPVRDDDMTAVRDARRNGTISVAVCETVPMQVVAECPVRGARDEQRMP
jgi:hypothetical protein